MSYLHSPKKLSSPFLRRSLRSPQTLIPTQRRAISEGMNINLDVSAAESNINGNTYKALEPLTFNSRAGSALIYDNHTFILRPSGIRLVSCLWGLSTYGSYYYYKIAF